MPNFRTDIPPEIASDLAELIDYNWDGEESDYCACLNGSDNQNEMFPLLVRLHNWLYPEEPVSLPRSETLFDFHENELPRSEVIELAIKHMHEGLAAGTWKSEQLPDPLISNTVGDLPDEEIVEWATTWDGHFPQFAPDGEGDQLAHRGGPGFCGKCSGTCAYDDDGQPIQQFREPASK